MTSPWACTVIFGSVEKAQKEVSRLLAQQMVGRVGNPAVLSSVSGVPLPDVQAAVECGSGSVETFSAITLAMQLCIDDIVPVSRELIRNKRDEIADEMGRVGGGALATGGRPLNEVDKENMLGAYLAIRVIDEIAAVGENAHTGT